MESDLREEQEQTRPKKSRWLYVVIGCSILFLVMMCLCLAVLFLAPVFLMYVDSNYIWCDVFGPLIPRCP
ncbi:MAG: hypothetical protein JXB38_06685 [Anaerolineales bacterium]|nr:hypothetical protein [Anaerolineales bacterium]